MVLNMSIPNSKQMSVLIKLLKTVILKQSHQYKEEIQGTCTSLACNHQNYVKSDVVTICYPSTGKLKQQDQKFKAILKCV